MTTRVMASFPALMRLAGDVGRAKKSGNPTKLRGAEKFLDDYVEVCRKSDGMITGATCGDMC